MPADGGSSAILLPVAAAEPYVSRWRLRHDASAAAGIPAHVTVLAPFLEPARLIDELLAELGQVLARLAAPHLRFVRTARFAPAGDAPGVLYLEPEPAAAIAELTDAVVARWPEAPPYGGLHTTVVPHLTVAIADEASLDAVESELAGTLGDGFTATLDRALVYVHAGARWESVASLPLGPAQECASVLGAH